MKRRIYIETTVVSYYTAHSSRDLRVAARQEETRALWPKFVSDYEAFISALVYEEARSGDPDAARRRTAAIQPFTVLAVSESATALAGHLVAEGAVPDACPEDAMHIAIAAVNGVDVIVSLNFKHINNPFKKSEIRRCVEGHGYVCPEICAPDELLESEND